MDVEKFKSDVSFLQELQEKEAILLEDLKKEEEKFKSFISEKKETLLETKKAIADQKELLNNEGVKIFNETGEKTLFGGLKIQSRTVKEYDERKAFDFAKEKGMFLLLDKKGFEKAASSLDLDFYEEKKVERVTFPKVIKLED